MRTRKVRGHNRLQKQINQYYDKALNQGLDIAVQREFDYVKFYISPWSNLVINRKSKPKEPKGKTRKLIFDGLLKVYDNWKQELEIPAKPYYLKIWIYYPNISQSQVVCAVNGRMNWYENMFTISAKENTPLIFKHSLQKLEWVHCYDEHQQSELWVGS